MSSAPESYHLDEGFGLESISELVGLDIEKKAKELVSQVSPVGKSKRLIAKPINFNLLSTSPATKPKIDINSNRTKP